MPDKETVKARRELFGNSEQLDTISRQEAINALNEQIEQCDKALSSFDISMKDEYAVKVERASLMAYKETIEYLPSAHPSADWIERTVSYDAVIEEWQSAKCSACGRYHTTPYMYYFDNYNYCPHCGARMRGDHHD